MIDQRLNLLRSKMKEENIDVYFFNTTDYHLSEYVPEYFKTVRYFSNFTGSLATLLVDHDSAYLFVDGRYHLQAEKETEKYGVEVVRLGTSGALEPDQFLEKNYQGKVLGLDGRRTSISIAKNFISKGMEIKDIDIYSDIIENRAELSNSKLFKLDEEFTGASSKEKLDKVECELNGKTHVINNLESIAYLLNLRGDDIIYTPVFMAYFVFTKGNKYLFVNKDRLTEDIKGELETNGVVIDDYDNYYKLLENIKGENVTLDENKVNYSTYKILKSNGNAFINERSLVEDLKAIKNSVECENAKLAHIYDGVAMLRFLMWLDKSDKSKISEYDAAEYLNKCRLDYKAFDLSFNPIVAYNENAAMMHYGPTKTKCSMLDNKGILLVDSGGQYKQGTTDITRTIALGEVSDELKKHFTLVLKSMFNLSSVKFLSGMSGFQLDILARKDIWAEGIDYRCGTGHGVGHVLAVHENPPNVRFRRTATSSEQTPIMPGHIFSDEPGIYLEGKYGIRCENMVLCVNDELNEYGQFLRLETLTMCPFDLRLIDEAYLDEKTKGLLNDYHKCVREVLTPYLNKEEKEYLEEITRKI